VSDEETVFCSSESVCASKTHWAGLRSAYRSRLCRSAGVIGYAHTVSDRVMLIVAQSKLPKRGNTREGVERLEPGGTRSYSTSTLSDSSFFRVSQLPEFTEMDDEACGSDAHNVAPGSHARPSWRSTTQVLLHLNIYPAWCEPCLPFSALHGFTSPDKNCTNFPFGFHSPVVKLGCNADRSHGGGVEDRQAHTRTARGKNVRHVFL
jgi:hypothetical protein